MSEVTVEYIKYGLTHGGERGVLGEDLAFKTPILGYDIHVAEQGSVCWLAPDGTLTLYAGFDWDFGSYAIDTPALVRASAAHDALCRLTDSGALPWACRRVSDAFFRDLLKLYSPGRGLIRQSWNFARRWWDWLGVSAYSQLIARWRVKKK